MVSNSQFLVKKKINVEKLKKIANTQRKWKNVFEGFRTSESARLIQL
jgi:hypothetical protein